MQITQKVAESGSGTPTPQEYQVNAFTDTSSEIDFAPLAASVTEYSKATSGHQYEHTLSVKVPTEAAFGRLRLRGGDERALVVLPGSELTHLRERVLTGEREAVEPLLELFSSPIQLVKIGGTGLKVDAFISVLETVCRTNRYAASRIHAYRYDIARGAITDQTGYSVDTFAELERLVAGMDAIEEIGPVDRYDAIGEIIATVPDELDEALDLLTAFGFDLETLETVEAAPVYAGLLALAADTGGIRVAEGYAMRSNRGRIGNYKRAKAIAETADHGERGGAWLELVEDAVRQSLDEFSYVLANALLWTGRERRTDSRLDELLYRGAEAAAQSIDLSTVAERARFERHVAKGHRLRGCHCYPPAIRHFATAERIAKNHDSLNPWGAIHSRGVVKAHHETSRGNHEAAITTIEHTLKTLINSEAPPELLNQHVHHLSGLKFETKSKLGGSKKERRSLLEEAKQHYQTVGFERSIERIDRKLHALAKPSTEKTEPRPPAKQPAKPHPQDTDPNYSTSEHHAWLWRDNAASPIDSDPTTDGFEVVDYPDEPYHDPGSRNGEDDPYIF